MNIRCVGGGEIITTLKNVINVNSQKSFTGLSDARFHFFIIVSLGAGLLLSFMEVIK